jgi:hypothetical protein
MIMMKTPIPRKRTHMTDVKIAYCIFKTHSYQETAEARSFPSSQKPDQSYEEAQNSND